MDGWAGFSDADLNRLKRQHSSHEGGCKIKHQLRVTAVFNTSQYS